MKATTKKARNLSVDIERVEDIVTISFTDIENKNRHSEYKLDIDTYIKLLESYVYYIEPAETGYNLAYHFIRILKSGLKKFEKSLKPTTSSLRFEVLKRDDYKCQVCGRTAQEDGVKLEVDHKTPRSKGGLTILENLWTLCYDCNRGKRDKDL